MGLLSFSPSLAALLLLCSLTATRAPGQIESDREEFTFHVYVDAIFGDNPQAWASNPGAPGKPLPLDPHPDLTVPKAIEGVLQQAPYAFKSLTTRPNQTANVGVIDWINTRFPSLPWTHPTSGLEVTQVVIHVLPGIYGPKPFPIPPAVDSPWVDNTSGMQVSGETWPVRLPDRVSLQGTSALDTVFHGFRESFHIDSNPIIEVTGAHEHSFIDGLTIRSAATDPADPFPGGAAIYIGGAISCKITVSNCFLFANDVGIAIDSRVFGPARVIHRPRIVNNTIAWNRCGLWNGDFVAGMAGPTVGFNEPLVANNVFDSAPPPVNPVAAVSGFEGMAAADMTVTAPAPAGDFNAWETAKVNLGVAIPFTQFGVTVPRAPWTPTGTHVDLTAITVTGGRGVLYVNDLFRLAPAVATDLSPHDFRLVPRVTQTPAAAPTQLNPLVDRGITGVLTFGNGGVLPNPPGLPVTAEDYPATLHGWDWDCEGYGNERIRARNGFAAGARSNIDLGADELDSLLIAGFIQSTRVFSRNVPNTVSIGDHTTIWFVDHPSGTYDRPVCNIYLGQTYHWWPHQQTLQAPCPDCASTNPLNYYTLGVPGNPPTTVASRRRDLTTASPALPTFMRALECDFSPHLLPDVHPYWSALFHFAFPFSPPRQLDIYAPSPWFESVPTTPNMLGGRVDNPYVYYNPGSSGSPSLSNLWGVGYHAIKVGMVSPPGSGWLGPPPQRYLFDQAPTFPFDLCPGGGSNTTYQTDTWGLGDVQTGCPDLAPDSSLFGMRFNCQYLGAAPTKHSNLQTFLTVNDDAVARSMGAPEATPMRVEDVIHYQLWLEAWERQPRRRR